jgi:hypothetical protein
VTVRDFRHAAGIRVFITCLHHRDHAALASRDINSYKLKIAHYLCCLFDIAMRFRHSSLPEMSGGSPFSESSKSKPMNHFELAGTGLRRKLEVHYTQKRRNSVNSTRISSSNWPCL